MPWHPKIGRHVSYRNGGKRRPGIITALNVGTNVTIRVGHHSETFADKPKGKASGQYRPG